MHSRQRITRSRLLRQETRGIAPHSQAQGASRRATQAAIRTRATRSRRQTPRHAQRLLIVGLPMHTVHSDETDLREPSPPSATKREETMINTETILTVIAGH